MAKSKGLSNVFKLRDGIAIVTDPAYGATGDGTTDDSVAIAAAIASGKRVIYPEGFTFLTQGQTLSTVGQIIEIRGKIKLKNSTNQSVFSVSANRVSIIGVGVGEIDANKANQTTAVDSLGSGVWLADGISGLKVEGCYIHDCKRNGVGGEGNNDDCTVFDNRIETVGFMGIYPSINSAKPSKRWQISANKVSGWTQDGVGTVGIQHGVISGNLFLHPSDGVAIGAISLEANCHYTSVFGNTVLGTVTVGGSGGGIQTKDSHHVTITGNTLKGLGDGISIPAGGATTYAISIVGNAIDDTGYGTGNAIQLVPGTTNYDLGAVVQGNVITNCPFSAIFVWGASHCQILGNNINGVNLQNSASKRFVSGIVLGNNGHYNTVNDNVINKGATGNLKIGIHEIGVAGAFSSGNTIRDNRIIGADFDIICSGTANGSSGYSKVTRVFDAAVTAAPTTGHFERGDEIAIDQPAAFKFSKYTVTKSGTFGATATTGTVNSASSQLTVASATGLYAGMRIKVVGAGAAAADLDTFIAAFDGTGLVCTLKDNAGTSVVAANITLVNPTFHGIGAQWPSNVAS